MGKPHDSGQEGLRIIASVVILLLVLVFVGILVMLGYGLWAAIAAVTTIGAIAAQITTKLLGNADDSIRKKDDSNPELPEPPEPPDNSGPLGLE